MYGACFNQIQISSLRFFYEWKNKFDAIDFGSNTIMMCLIWSDHVNEWSAKNDGMINIFYNDKECFKRNVVVENRGFGFYCNMQF